MAKKKRRFGGKNGTVRRVLTGDDSPSSIPFYQRKWSLSSTKIKFSCHVLQLTRTESGYVDWT